MNLILKKSREKYILIMLFCIIAALIMLSLHVTETAKAWDYYETVGEFSGTATIYRHNNPNITSKDITAASKDNLIQKLEIKVTAAGHYEAVITFKSTNSATNYQSSSNQYYWHDPIGPGRIYIINGNNRLYSQSVGSLNSSSTTIKTISLGTMTYANPNTDQGLCRIEIAYKYRNNIIASNGNYIVWKSAPINTFKMPETFLKVDSLVNMNTVGSTTSLSSFVLINNELLEYATIHGFVKKNSGSYIALFEGFMEETYYGYKTLALSLNINTFTFYDIYGTSYQSIADNPNITYNNISDFTITRQ